MLGSGVPDGEVVSVEGEVDDGGCAGEEGDALEASEDVGRVGGSFGEGYVELRDLRWSREVSASFSASEVHVSLTSVPWTRPVLVSLMRTFIQSSWSLEGGNKKNISFKVLERVGTSKLTRS